MNKNIQTIKTCTHLYGELGSEDTIFNNFGYCLECQKENKEKCDKEIMIECNECNGKGTVDCEYCDGMGEITNRCDLGHDHEELCDDCDDGEVECSQCDGKGKVVYEPDPEAHKNKKLEVEK